jgi:hypothetical protein
LLTPDQDPDNDKRNLQKKLSIMMGDYLRIRDDMMTTPMARALMMATGESPARVGTSEYDSL